jgi:UDP-N-acetyl-2-amino-2-deoxyglucuronate dehydrogenase
LQKQVLLRLTLVVERGPAAERSVDMKKTWRGVLIGAGGFVRKNTNRALLELKDRVQIVGVCDVDEESITAASVPWGKAGVDVAGYPVLDTMLSRLKPELAFIGTPSGSHVTHAIQCMRAGVIPMVEKPVGITAESLQELLKVQQATEMWSAAGIFQNRYSPHFNLLLNAVGAGRFGDSRNVAIDIRLPWKRDDNYYLSSNWKGTWTGDGGGAGMNQGVHQIDMLLMIARALLGFAPEQDPIKLVSGNASNRAHVGIIAVEDTINLTLTLSNDARATFYATTAEEEEGPWTINVSGNGCEATLTDGKLTKWDFSQSAKGDANIIANLETGESTGGAVDPLAVGHALHRRQIEHWLDCLDSKQPYPVDLRAAAEAPQLLCDFYDAEDVQGKLPPMTVERS